MERTTSSCGGNCNTSCSGGTNMSSYMENQMKHMHTIAAPYHSHGIMMGADFDGDVFVKCNYQNRPCKTIEEDCMITRIYKAPGFNNHNTDVKEEWVNKTKEMYINVYGRNYIHTEEEIVDIRLFFDNSVYDKYRVRIEDGLIIITFYEIANEKPQIERLED